MILLGKVQIGMAAVSNSNLFFKFKMISAMIQLSDSVAIYLEGSFGHLRYDYDTTALYTL